MENQSNKQKPAIGLDKTSKAYKELEEESTYYI